MIPGNNSVLATEVTVANYSTCFWSTIAKFIIALLTVRTSVKQCLARAKYGRAKQLLVVHAPKRIRVQGYRLLEGTA